MVRKLLFAAAIACAFAANTQRTCAHTINGAFAQGPGNSQTRYRAEISAQEIDIMIFAEECRACAELSDGFDPGFHSAKLFRRRGRVATIASALPGATLYVTDDTQRE